MNCIYIAITTIIADPEAKLYKNHQKGAMLANDLRADKGGYSTSENITIIGGIWDSFRETKKDKGTESFRFIHGTNITIKDATICNVPVNSHLITFAGIKDGLIDNCTLYGYTGTVLKEAIQLDIVHNDVVVPSMQAEDILYDDLPCDGITISNCEIYDYPRAIGSHTSVKGVFHKNIVIKNNTLHDLDEAAIKAYDYINLQVIGNTIYNAKVGVFAYTYLSNQQNHYFDPLNTTKKESRPKNYNILIKDNYIHDITKYKSGTTYTYGDAIRAYGISTRPLYGVTITGNKIEEVERFGIYSSGTPNVSITDNSVLKTSDSGIYISNGSKFSTITNNTLTETGSGNTESGAIGISICNDVDISNNTITKSGNNGITLLKESISCDITDNTITSPGANGIYLSNQSNENYITNNLIKYYKTNGIYMENINSVKISDNSIYATTGNKSKDGICIIGTGSKKSSFTIDNNYIKDTSGYGIYLINAPGTLIHFNTIIHNVKFGIYLDKGSNNSKICYNTVNSTSGNGGIEVTESKKVLSYSNYGK